MQAKMIDGHLRIWKALLTIVVTASLVAEPVSIGAAPAPIGNLATGSNTTVNGRVVSAGTSLYAGDRILTQDNSTASISIAGGSEIILINASALRLQRQNTGIEGTIETGSAAILSSTALPIIADAGGVRIVPAQTGSVYEVELHGSSLTVTVRKGLAHVEALNRSIEVNAGNKLEAVLADQGPEGNSTPALSSRIVRFTIIAAAVVATAALAILIVNSSATCKVSPSSVGSCEIVH